MKVEFVDGAIEDLEELDDRQLKAVKSKIDELRENPTGHEDVKLIRIRGRDIYRLEIKEERSGEIDHRAIYDIDDREIRVYSVIYRDSGYQDKEIAERF